MVHARTQGPTPKIAPQFSGQHPGTPGMESWAQTQFTLRCWSTSIYLALWHAIGAASTKIPLGVR